MKKLTAFLYAYLAVSNIAGNEHFSTIDNGGAVIGCTYVRPVVSSNTISTSADDVVNFSCTLKNPSDLLSISECDGNGSICRVNFTFVMPIRPQLNDSLILHPLNSNNVTSKNSSEVAANVTIMPPKKNDSSTQQIAAVTTSCNSSKSGPENCASTSVNGDTSKATPDSLSSTSAVSAVTSESSMQPNSAGVETEDSGSSSYWIIIMFMFFIVACLIGLYVIETSNSWGYRRLGHFNYCSTSRIPLVSLRSSST